mgnify:CR=1 FL=1
MFSEVVIDGGTASDFFGFDSAFVATAGFELSATPWVLGSSTDYAGSCQDEGQAERDPGVFERATFVVFSFQSDESF